MLRTRLLLALTMLLLLAGCLPGPELKPASRLPRLEQLGEPAVRPTSTPRPSRPRATAEPDETPEPLPEGDDAVAVKQAAAEGLERDPIMLAAAFRGLQLPAPTPEPRSAAVGDSEEFWVLNINAGEFYSTQATLEAQTEHLNIFVSSQSQADRPALERSARRFEDETLPKLLEIFEGQVDSPVVTVLIADIPGAAGYYSAEDLLPRAANPYSNERPMIYMSPSVAPGTSSFDSTLAHETQHLLHRRILVSPALWFNEGSSMLIERLLSYEPDSFAYSFLGNPDIQLNTWSDSPGSSISHYAQSQLFLSYLYDRLGDRLPLAQLTREDAGHNLDEFAKLTGDEDLGDLVADWSVANLLNDPEVGDGRYAYDALPETIAPLEVEGDELTSEVSQLGADYLLFPEADEERVVRFEGEQLVPLTSAELAVDEQAWWSGRGDNRVSTLTTTLDLRAATAATLRFQLWHHLEQDYDYGFVAASTDGGRTWKTLPGRHTTTDNPQGLSYGDGYTGTSGGWLEEEIDLSSLAGQEVVLGFWSINDQGFNTPGMLVKDMRVEGLDGALDWRATGFVQVHNRLPQTWELRAVELGDSPAVLAPEPEDGRAAVTIPAGARAVLVVIGTTPETTEPGRYRLSVEK